jgi:hypothetical protein
MPNKNNEGTRIEHTSSRTSTSLSNPRPVLMREASSTWGNESSHFCLDGSPIVASLSKRAELIFFWWCWCCLMIFKAFSAESSALAPAATVASDGLPTAPNATPIFLESQFLSLRPPVVGSSFSSSSWSAPPGCRRQGRGEGLLSAASKDNDILS